MGTRPQSCSSRLDQSSHQRLRLGPHNEKRIRPTFAMEPVAGSFPSIGIGFCALLPCRNQFQEDLHASARGPQSKGEANVDARQYAFGCRHRRPSMAMDFADAGGFERCFAPLVAILCDHSSLHFHKLPYWVYHLLAAYTSLDSLV